MVLRHGSLRGRLRAGAAMREGLYKVEMHTVVGARRGVLYVYDGQMMGGNSAFAFIGTYRTSAVAN